MDAVGYVDFFLQHNPHRPPEHGAVNGGRQNFRIKQRKLLSRTGMLLFGSTSTICSVICPIGGKLPTRSKFISLAYTSVTTGNQIVAAIAAVATTALVLSAGRGEVAGPQQQEETLSNIPQTLSSECTAEQKDCKRRYKIQRPKSRKAERCTSKCTTVCMQGGFGSPGEGPFSIRRPLVVFKDGFRSRKYCLSECSDICNLIGDGDDVEP